MNWIIFAIIGPAILAITNIADKFIISRAVKYPIAHSMIIAGIQVIYAVFLALFFKIQFSYPASLFAIAAGIIWLLATFTYVRSIKMEEVSRVLSLIFLSPIFTALFAFILLSENLTLFRYAGIFLLVLSAILIVRKKISGNFRYLPALKIIAIGVPLYGLLAVMEKFGLNSLDYVSFYFWYALGACMFGFLFLGSGKLRFELRSQFSLLRSKGVLGYELIAEFVALLGFMAIYVAISLTSVSLVTALGSIQPLFVFIYTLTLSWFFPRILKEELTRQTVLLKIISVLLIIAGGWLIVS